MEGAKLSKIAKKFNLKNFTEKLDLNEHYVLIADVNRPALQLNGFYEHFEEDRVQLIGMVEQAYLSKMTREERIKNYRELLFRNIPCLIFCRGFEPEPELIDVATERGIPLLGTDRATSNFMSDLIYNLQLELAPCTTIHGVLMDVYGEGLLITGESGIGKSEAALELIRRGHRLVSDDVVEIRKVSNDTLIGTSPDITRHFIELRGIGIVDVKSLFGVESVMLNSSIDMVIRVEDWNREANYDRLGLEEDYIEFLGNKVVCYSIPIRPGRNLAVIVESAAINFRAKKMGYNAAQELYNRVTCSLKKSQEEDEQESGTK